MFESFPKKEKLSDEEILRNETWEKCEEGESPLEKMEAFSWVGKVSVLVDENDNIWVIEDDIKPPKGVKIKKWMLFEYKGDAFEKVEEKVYKKEKK